MSSHAMLFSNEGHSVPDSLGFRKRIGIVVPSTNTTVQPECEGLRPRGVTNHVARSTIKERPLNTEQAFFEHMQDMLEKGLLGIQRSLLNGRPCHMISDATRPQPLALWLHRSVCG